MAGAPASGGEGERSSVDGKAVGKVRQSDRVGWLVARVSDASAKSPRHVLQVQTQRPSKIMNLNAKPIKLQVSVT